MSGNKGEDNHGTVYGFIVVGTNFVGLNRKDIFVRINFGGYYIFLHKSYRKSSFFGTGVRVDRTLHKNHKNSQYTKSCVHLNITRL